ncbi:serine hydrolase domain-containing protein [Dyadobacter psychrotolerans]|uniref:Class A beta-lactamase-related serine hydrolase n=1 Tax=Dyadobacter psychrotolerans TaxID=2541721 RepID=A0A4R5DN50_9BACT|nr:serine hydrolase domain-containing protein [Dyadobacter psychrotolerans]TDE12133.1 class A beta-lactamase-related serine hydrolase [Dyadobacter psychrotolerans]
MTRLLTSVFFFLLLIGCAKDDTTVEPVDKTQVDIPQVDDAVSSFMATYSVPGVSVAITKDGKLVYAKSYGKSDKTSGKDLTNATLFRIASVSKTVTGLAILKLAETGKLSLDQKVFGPQCLFGTTYTAPAGQVGNITVRQLLQHTSGGWGNSVNDPMFTNAAMSQDQLISWTLANRPLTSVPGAKYDYSNFGYCVLGKVIEKVTGQTYEQWVKANILQPSGITRMSIGGNTLADKKEDETTYYGQGGENPYIYNVARMDAHGGWIASATDLARLLVRMDGFSGKPDLLNAESMKTLTTGSTANVNYACGLAVNAYNNWWHTGSLPGTATEIVRTPDGFCWVILCNTRSTSSQFINDMDAVIWKAVNNKSTVWPNVDQF